MANHSKFGYKRTKLKEFLSSKSKRKSITINSKYETTTVTGVPINKNGKPIIQYETRK